MEPLRSRLRHSVDILLFNPPYVPTDSDEADEAQQGANIAGAWAGGQDGMAVTDILLDQVEVRQAEKPRNWTDVHATELAESIVTTGAILSSRGKAERHSGHLSSNARAARPQGGGARCPNPCTNPFLIILVQDRSTTSGRT